MRAWKAAGIADNEEKLFLTVVFLTSDTGVGSMETGYIAGVNFGVNLWAAGLLEE